MEAQVPVRNLWQGAFLGSLALVIGNGAYKDAPLDACGFQVTLLADASQRDMENGIRDFGDRGLAQAMRSVAS